MSNKLRAYYSAPALETPPSHPQSDITTTAMDDFRQLFDMFDTNHNGTIDFSEFTHILRMLGDDCPHERALHRMLRVACETSATQPLPTALTFDQFIRFFAIYKQDWPTHVTDREIFAVLDYDNGGTVSPAELVKVLSTFGMRVSEDEANAMAEFATPFPGPNDIRVADIAAVAESVRRLRQTSTTTDTSDTSEDDTAV